MPNLDDVLAEHRHVPCCTRDFESDCTGDPVRKPEGCKGCDHLGIDLTGCKRCGQDELLAWLRENCKLTRTKERNPYLTKEFSTVKNSVASVAGSQGFDRGIDSQLAQDQQTINKILGVE
ncbi:hypothetical protein X792_04925 [Dehalococcoides mccartyi CG1]|jgi:hypothetical protein|uniref:hypothetical protein n=1 Tax=Dehalococcoides mccartyi TaxID=61435 RepID=UPI0004E038E5|nr:hypothetical protein [Dehalococcoides mccartyi]AII58716.1 hypothetical protein X792_04925 [Dehalococcoides mccartyi CG1]